MKGKTLDWIAKGLVIVGGGISIIQSLVDGKNQEAKMDVAAEKAVAKLINKE